MENELGKSVDYDKLADAIANKLKLKLVPVHEIWDCEQCAAHLKCSIKHFRDRVSKKSNFPPQLKHYKNRWQAIKVIEWTKKH